MLRSLRVKQFKSLADIGPVYLAPFTVLFGPNAAGKSNVLDAIQVLSRLASERTVSDALREPVRGRPLEAFMLPEDGLPALLDKPESRFFLGADIDTRKKQYRYQTEIAIRPASGALECLTVA